MLVQTMTRAPSPYLHDGASSSSLRTFHIPRLKIAASSLLRHGNTLPLVHHQHQLYAELRQQNSCRAACRLSEGTLQKIFIISATQCIDARVTNPQDPNNSWSWVNVSYVCHKWRLAALGCQDFWRYIDFSHPKWYNITLERSKMSSLHINATVTDLNIRQLHRTMHLAHRIQDIHISSTIERIHPLLEVLSHPNPVLELLVVDVQIPFRLTYADVYDSPTFPTSGAPLKNLKYMELHSAPFYLLTSRCTFLIQFHLHDLPLTERPTLRYFLFMLEQLTRLEHLTLDRAFPINMDVDDVRSLDRRMSLPNLQTLSLVGSVPEMASILECIEIPSSARLVAKIHTLRDLQECISTLAQSIGSQPWAGSGEEPLETLVLTGYEAAPRFMADSCTENPQFRQSLRIRAFKSDTISVEPAIDFTIDPFELNPSDETIITALTAIWSALDLSRVHTLALQDLDIVTQKSWTTLLQSLPSLQVLDITGRVPSGLVWALLLNARAHGQWLSGMEDGDEQRLLIPHINDIYLHRVDCSSGGYMVAWHAPINSHFDLDDSRFLDVLNTSLQERRRYGLCLRSLSIARCDFVMKQSVEDARRAVSYLICDFRNTKKNVDLDADEICPARYYGGWDFGKLSDVRHYYRLRALEQIETDF